LIAAVLLMSRCYCWLGAVLALGMMGGAIMSHLTVLGIVVQNDGGLLFALAITVAVCSTTTLALHRRQIPFVAKFFTPKNS